MKNVRLIADRLAQGLSGAVSDNGQFATVRDELATLARLYRESFELRAVLRNPVVPSDAKGKAIAAIADKLGFASITKKFLAAMARTDQLALIPQVSVAVGRALDRRMGIYQATVTTTVALDETLRRRLVEALEQMTGGTIRLEEKVDRSLLGGVVVEVAGKRLDGTLRTKLDRLLQQLAVGAAV